MMRPFFSFYGGKWRDTPRNYPAPKHDTIVEPFAGSAGYSVRYYDRRVILIDKDPILVGVWSYLIRTPADEILTLPDVPDGGSVDDLDVCQEARWLIGFWLNKAVAAPVKRPSAWMRSGRYGNSFWGDRVRQTIAGQVDRIRHWQVIHGTYADAPDIPATWFVDPPYAEAGKHYRFGSSGIDYDHLGAWCRSRRGLVIACENDGASWLPFERVAAVKTTRRGGRSVEASWIREEMALPYPRRGAA